MRRFVLALMVLAAVASLPGSAEAHGWRHGPWRHGHWHRGWGWGGWGWRGGVGVTVGWPAFGGYFPAYGGWGYPGCYSFCPPVLDNCYGYPGTTIVVGPAYGARYSPALNRVDYLVDSSYEPAELAYGPLAVKQFLGLDRNFGLGPLRAPPIDLGTPRIEGKTVRLKVRPSNPESRRRAERYIAQGDELFRKHNWHSALQKYKLAGQLAPDMPECFWRQGHAAIGVNQYGQAAAAFRRAMLLDEDTSRSGFKLSDLYTDSEAAKTSHLESLAGEALAAPDSADAYLLLGVLLHYDGQADRARPFFHKAGQLAGEQSLMQAFLAPKAEESPIVPVKAPDMEI